VAKRQPPRALGYHFDAAEPVVREDGKPACRFCKGPVVHPRKTFCSGLCVDAWRFRTDPEFMRETVFKSFKGVCQACRTDTTYLDFHRVQKQVELRVRWAWGTAKQRADMKAEGEIELDDGQPRPICHWVGMFARAAHWREENRVQAGRSAAEVDHVVPVSEGGDYFDPANLTLLCVPCHRKKSSADSDRRRAAQKSGGAG
jgi:hypothetical protein